MAGKALGNSTQAMGNNGNNKAQQQGQATPIINTGRHRHGEWHTHQAINRDMPCHASITITNNVTGLGKDR